MIEFQSIVQAHQRIKDYINRTPIMTSATIDELAGCKVFFKCENFQRVGAFKFRGAINTLSQLSSQDSSRGVIAHSSGNHAQALSLAASILDIKCTIVMPRNSPKVKVDATRGYGAEVVFCEPTLEARESTTNALIEQNLYVLIHPYNDERIMAGAGTAALELLQDNQDLQALFCPVGGGGLLSGTVTAVKGMNPETLVIAVEPKNADDAYRSFHSGHLVPSVNPNTIADGLRTSLGPKTFEVILDKVDEILTVSESEILSAMRLLFERMKLVVEPSGAVALAGLLSKKVELVGSRMGVIISGGNVDLDPLFSHYSKMVPHASKD